jgi:hypothetical protein
MDLNIIQILNRLIIKLVFLNKIELTAIKQYKL